MTGKKDTLRVCALILAIAGLLIGIVACNMIDWDNENPDSTTTGITTTETTTEVTTPEETTTEVTTPEETTTEVTTPEETTTEVTTPEETTTEVTTPEETTTSGEVSYRFVPNGNEHVKIFSDGSKVWETCEPTNCPCGRK